MLPIQKQVMEFFSMAKKSTKTTSITDQIANLEKKLAQISDSIATQTAQTQVSTQAPPPESPQTQVSPPELQSPSPQNSQYATVQKSRSKILAEYEQDYLQRLEKKL